MFCTECGEENRNYRKFCSNCGTKLQDYTKPVENPIMPEEIAKEQEKVKQKNKINKIFNIVLASLLFLAVGFTIISFFTQNVARQTFAILCIVMFVGYFAGCITKSVLIKKVDKK